MSKKKGFHHHLVAQLSFLPLSTYGLPLLRFLLILFFWNRHCFLFFFLAAGDTGPPGS